MDVCGHLAYCGDCRDDVLKRQVIAKSMNPGKTKNKVLSEKVAKTIQITCPVCRAQGLDLYLELYLLDIHTYYIFNIHTPWNPITHSYTMGCLGIVLIEYLWNQQIQYCSACRVGVGHTAAAGASCGWRVPRSGCVLHSGLANAAGRHIGHSCPGGGGVGPPPNICSWCM